MKSRVREQIGTFKGWAEQTFVADTITFTGERTRLTHGCSASEEPSKQDMQSTEPLLEKEESGCHKKKTGSL